MNRTGRALTLGCLLLLQPLLALAEGGNSLLIPATGRCTFDTQPEDLQNALKACERTAESGDAQAQYELALLYDQGDRVERSLPTAAEWYRRAAEQGHVEAQVRLAAMYFAGHGVPLDAAVAARWYLAAASAGHAGAQSMLAGMYDSGSGVERNADLAAHWYREAARQGDAAAGAKTDAPDANPDGAAR